jgi:hypothetical protein
MKLGEVHCQGLLTELRAALTMTAGSPSDSNMIWCYVDRENQRREKPTSQAKSSARIANMVHLGFSLVSAGAFLRVWHAFTRL